jgi:tagatose-1,6-bisphosphate aldolase non-catalytic subunit AgaZ/GatZ
MIPKIFIGPMSKNIVDSVIKYSEKYDTKIGLIASRRQVDFDGGYVNNWNTEDFCEYVKSKTKNVLLVRDHAGPEQGKIVTTDICL